MGSLKCQHGIMAEVSHQINSPLAAIRNALFLAVSRTKDPEIRHYLELADEEVSSIANRMRELRSQLEEVSEREWDSDSGYQPRIMRKAA